MKVIPLRRDRKLQALLEKEGSVTVGEDDQQLGPQDLAREVKRIIKAMRSGQQPTDEDLDILDQARDCLLTGDQGDGELPRDDAGNLDQEELIDDMDREEEDEARETSESILAWVQDRGPLPKRSKARRGLRLLTEGRSDVVNRSGIPIGRQARLDWLRRP